MEAWRARTQLSSSKIVESDLLVSGSQRKHNTQLQDTNDYIGADILRPQ